MKPLLINTFFRSLAFCSFKLLRIGAPSLILFTFACSPTEPIFKDNEISLEIDAEVTETWITLSSIPVEKDATYFVSRDSQLIFEGKLINNDTIIHDEGLEPAQNYNYTVFASKKDEQSKSISTIATTMDTTSHDFIWNVIKVSDALDVRLHDVAIIDENNIYVVGFIPNAEGDNYNIVHWNGIKWDLDRIIIKGNIVTEGPYEINSIFTITNDNIWVSHGSYGHWDGEKWVSEYKALPWRKIWGENNNVWFVGMNGKISNYNGQNWKAEESNTTINLHDIYGYYDTETSERIVYACGFNFNQDEAIILKKDNEAEWQIFDNGQNGIVSAQAYPDFSSLWLKDLNTFVVASFSDVLKVRNKGDNNYSVRKILDGRYGIYRLRGNDINDLFVAGDNTDMRHYNGKSWHLFSELGNGTVHSLDFKDDMVVAVSNGTIIIGTRH